MTFETVCRETRASRATVTIVTFSAIYASLQLLNDQNRKVHDWIVQVHGVLRTLPPHYPSVKMRRRLPGSWHQMFRQSQLQPQLQPKLQPLLHDLAITVRAPSCALSGVDGQIRPAGVQGLFTADVRVIDRAVLRVDDREPTPIAWSPGGPGVASFVAVARWLGDPGPDPTVRVTRTRRVTAAGMTEEISITSTASVPVQATVTVELGCDLAPIDEVKAGLIPVALPAVQAGGDGWRWSTGGTVVVAGGT